MVVLPFVIAVTALFIAGLVREPRSFWNAVVLMIDIGLVFLAMAAGKGIWTIIAALAVILFPLVFFGFSIYLIINGIKILKKEHFSVANSLSLALGLFMIFGSIFSFFGMIYFQDISVERSVFYLLIIIELYLAFSFCAFFVYSWLYTYMPKKLDCDYIIVHGCGLKNGDTVTPLLKGRVDKAVAVYYKAKCRPKLVVSGGKGSDEKISEAEAMKNYLLSCDFPEKDIIIEDNSYSTFENLKNVKEIFDVNGEKHSYIFVTNNYHVFRTGLYARKLKMKAQGVGCRTAGYYWPSAFIREYIALMVKYKWVFAAIVFVWAIMEIVIH